MTCNVERIERINKQFDALAKAYGIKQDDSTSAGQFEAALEENAAKQRSKPKK